ALADVHRLDVVGQPGLLEEDRDLVAVRRRPIVEVEHLLLPGVMSFVNGGNNTIVAPLRHAPIEPKYLPCRLAVGIFDRRAEPHGRAAGILCPCARLFGKRLPPRIRSGAGFFRDICRTWRALHPGLILASRTTLPHLSISAATKARNSSGVLARDSTLSWAKRSATSGSSRTALSPALSLPTISGAVPAGADAPRPSLASDPRRVSATPRTAR